MSGEAGSIGTLTACGEPHPIGLDPLDPGFRRRLDRDALTGRGMGALRTSMCTSVVTLLGLAFARRAEARASISSCISKASTPRQRPGKRCFRCWACLPSSSAASSRSGSGRAYDGPKAEGAQLARPPIAEKLAERIREARAAGVSVRAAAVKFEVSAEPFSGSAQARSSKAPTRAA
jgi:hypothetical protein